jgi:hypothetical protein
VEKIIKILVTGVVFVLVSIIPVFAVEQGSPLDTLSLEQIPFFEYDLYKKTGPKKYTLKIPVSIATQGLKGPLPQDNPVAAYFWERFKDKGMKQDLEYSPSAAKDYQTPYMRITAMQQVGTPVKIKILAPDLDDIVMPLAKEGGKSGNTRYQVIKRIFNVRIVDREGEMTLDKDKEKIKLVQNNDTLEMSWVPSMVEGRRGPKLAAPIVVEIKLEYKIRLESILDGKYLGGWHQEGWVQRRVAWIAMPVCGMEFGEDDEPIACPASMDPGTAWQEHSLGPVSLQVPSTWESDIRNGSGKFELGDRLAGISVVREEGAEDQVNYMKEHMEKKTSLSGLKAVEHTGLVRDGKYRARMIIFDKKLSDGKVLAIATVLKDDKYAAILEAALASVTIDSGKSAVPGTDPIPDPHVPELLDLGSGDYHYSPDNIPQKEYTQLEPAPNQTPREEAGAVLAKPAPENVTPAAAEPMSSGSLKLKKIKGFSDYVGRTEVLQGDGSPDSQLRLEITAPNQTITRLSIREKNTQHPIWDTENSSGVWRIAITQKNKPIYQGDEALRRTLGAGKEKYDLWLQDNHMLAAGKKELSLVVTFDNNKVLIIPLER